MALRKVITTENPILRKKAKKVHHFDSSLQRLVEDMFETMHASNGVGLAGPQIAQSIRVLVAEYEDPEEGEHHRVTLFNPEIVKTEGEELGTEGCLSIPGYVGDNIRRSAKILVKGQDVKGKGIRVHAQGWFARILQHEIDHLDGILFLDRLERAEDLREVTAAEEAEDEAVGIIE